MLQSSIMSAVKGMALKKTDEDDTSALVQERMEETLWLLQAHLASMFPELELKFSGKASDTRINLQIIITRDGPKTADLQAYCADCSANVSYPELKLTVMLPTV